MLVASFKDLFAFANNLDPDEAQQKEDFSSEIQIARHSDCIELNLGFSTQNEAKCFCYLLLSRKWKEDVGSRSNENQKDAVYKVAAYSHMALPPLLIVGPFGTGKTYTLAQCAKHVLMEEKTRILICTHSNR